MDKADQCTKLPPFLNNTYDIVDDSSTNEVVSWTSDKIFRVWEPTIFARDLCPKYFKHSNFNSFVRQLNTYGFQKGHSDRWEFTNEEFLRGQKDRLKNITRRKQVSHCDTPQQQTQNSTLGPCAEVRTFGLEEEVETLKSDVARLQQEHQQNEHTLQAMRERLQASEQLVKQQEQQMMTSLATEGLQNPGLVGFLAQLVQKIENNKHRAADTKGKAIPRQEIEGGSGATGFDGQIVEYHPASTESEREELMELFNTADLPFVMDTTNSFGGRLPDVGSSSMDQAEESDLSNHYSGVTLTEMQVCPPDSTTALSTGEIPTELPIIALRLPDVGSSSMDQAEESDLSDHYSRVTLSEMQVCPPTALPTGEISTELPIIALLPLAEEPARLEVQGLAWTDEDFIVWDQNAAESTPDDDPPGPASSPADNEGLVVSEIDQGSPINDNFWEQFFDANPASLASSSIDAETVDSAEQTGAT